MRKRVFAKCLGIIFGILLLMPAIVEAKEIGEFDNFRITRYYVRTGYLEKYNSGENYVMNLYPSEDLAPMTVKHRLVNSNLSVRSGEHITRCGQRDTCSNWGSSGYIYALQVARQNWWDGAAAITGSWSPDSD